MIASSFIYSMRIVRTSCLSEKLLCSKLYYCMTHKEAKQFFESLLLRVKHSNATNFYEPAKNLKVSGDYFAYISFMKAPFTYFNEKCVPLLVNTKGKIWYLIATKFSASFISMRNNSIPPQIWEKTCHWLIQILKYLQSLNASTVVLFMKSRPWKNTNLHVVHIQNVALLRIRKRLTMIQNCMTHDRKIRWRTGVGGGSAGGATAPPKPLIW